MIRKIVTLLFLLIATCTQAADYYWVGGSGNWSEISHWATTSGGTSYHSVVPSQNDDVYFDQNSGFTAASRTVTLNNSVQSCRNMTWSDAGSSPIISGSNSQDLQIYGSLELQSLMSFNVQRISFLSNVLGQSIKSNSTIVGGLGSNRIDVIFNGEGSWAFQDNITFGEAGGALNFIKGSIYTNGYEWNIPSLLSNYNTVRKLYLSSSIINIRAYEYPYFWRFTGNNRFIDAGTSHIRILANNVWNNGFVGGNEDRYYHLSFTGQNLDSPFLQGGIYCKKLNSNSDLVFIDNNSFDTLDLAPSKIYQFKNGSNQTINKLFKASSPICGNLISLVGRDGVGSISLATTCEVEINRAFIAALNFNSQNMVVAMNSFDMDNNQGISFVTPSGKILYWVGGQGDWENSDHWSENNDGVFPASSGGCVPTPIDNVVFNQNSGFSTGSRLVSFTTEIYCNNMIWDETSSNPIFRGSWPVNIYGSLDLQLGMFYNVKSTQFRSSIGGNTIRTNGVIIGQGTGSYGDRDGNVFFNGNGGTWDLLDNYQSGMGASHTANSITVVRGALRTNGFTLRIGAFNSEHSGYRSVNLGSSEVYMSGGWNASGTNFILNADSSILHFIGYYGGMISNISTANYNQIFCHASTFDYFEMTSLIRAKRIEIISRNVRFSGVIHTDTLILAQNKRSQFTSGLVTINSLFQAATPSCTGLSEIIGISSTQSRIVITPATVVILSGAVVSNISIEGVSPIIVIDCMDEGNNTGIIFSVPNVPRVLYWVGGAGDWNDYRHWSMTNDGIYPASSGGCVPTVFDDVVFNENSGLGSNSRIIQLNGINQYCKDMKWQNVQGNPIIQGNSIVVSGSLYLQSNMIFGINDILFNSNLDEVIETNGSVIGGEYSNVIFNGDGVWNLVDNCQFISNSFSGNNRSIELRKGSLNTNGFDLSVSSFISNNNNTRNIDLSDSRVTVRSNWNVQGNNLFFNSNGSEIVLTSNSASFTSNQIYNRILFSPLTDNNSIVQLNGSLHATYLSVSASANFTGSNSFDTLVLRPGKTYQLQSGREQIVNKRLFTSGSPCEVIQVSSTNAGSPAKFSVMGGPNIFDFTRVKDIDASNSYDRVNFEAHSVDMGGNTNMSFIPYDASSPIVGLGADVNLTCPLHSYTIPTHGFYGSPTTSYLWSDGSTEDHLDVNRFGTYTVKVTYSTGCSISDSLKILAPIDNDEPVITNCPSNLTVSSDQDLCTAAVSWIVPTATDLCQLDSLVSNYDPGDVFNVGTTTVTYRAYDASLNTSTCSFTVTVEDVQVPTITYCPSNQSVAAASGTCNAVVSWSEPTYTDNCTSTNDLLLTISHNSGSTFSLGATTVTYTIEDEARNTSTCSFVVEVSGAMAPIVSNCPSDISINALPGSCEAPATWVEPIAVDGCSGIIMNYLVRSHAPGSVFAVASTPVAYLYEDSEGNLGYCTFTVTVVDTESPVFVGCPNDITLNETGSSCGAVVNWVSPIATDNCGIPTIVTTSLISGSVFPGGTTAVIYTAVDGSGNTSVCSFNVKVVDVTPPVISNCPSNISVSSSLTVCSADVMWVPPTAIDNCGAAVTVTSTHQPGATFSRGISSVVYTFSDGVNSSVCSFNVTVIDISKPIVSGCPSDITINQDLGRCSAVVDWRLPTAVDACTGISLSVITVSFPPGSIFPVGHHAINYLFENSSGNTETCNFYVTVVDNVPPVFTNGCPSNVVVPVSQAPCIATATWTPPAVTDACSSPVTITCTSVPGGVFPLGPTTVTYNATDAVGNVATCSFIVTVEDSQGPVFVNCPQNITVDEDGSSCGAIVTWTAPTASDNCGFTTIISTSPLSGTVFHVGTTPIIYTAVDGGGNTTTCSFNIVVNDVTDPVVVDCPSNITHRTDAGTCSASVIWVEPKATDNCGSAVTVTRTHAPNELFSIGVTPVTYLFSDGVNSIGCSFTITVVDEESPTIVNCPSNISLPQYAMTCETIVSWTPPTASDACGTLITVNSSHEPGDGFLVGTTTVTYEFRDESGNLSTCSFDVTIVDNVAPFFEITCPNDVTLTADVGTCEAVVTWVSPTARDICGSTPTVFGSHTSGATFPVGTTMIVYTARDESNNMTTCSFNVIVVDGTAPVVSNCPTDITFSTSPQACEAIVYWNPPTAIDLCGSNITVTSTHSPGATFNVGTTAVTYTFSDGVNSIDCVFNVIVEDNAVPIFTNCPQDIDLVNESGTCNSVATWTPPTAIDACGGGNLIVTSTHIPGGSFSSGTTLVVYTATNVNGTSSTCSFEINVEDTESPTIALLNVSTEICFGDSVYWEEVITDNCEIDTVIYSHVNGSILPLGVTTITILAIDFFGNSATHSFHVHVNELPITPQLNDLSIEACSTTDLLVSVSNPSFNLLYSWIHNGIFVNVGPSFSLKNVQQPHQGTYTIQSENSYGCITQSEMLLTITDCEIFIPESFSPNGDGNNDYFEIPALGNYPNTKLWINNRWGVEVFQSDNYQNDWNGHSTSSITVGEGALPEGTYYYILQLGGDATQVGSGTVYKGYVYLKP